jgi:hypothetical protein
MATVVNFIDTTLQNAPVRTINLPTAQVLVTPSAPAFHVATDGTITPTSITFAVTLIDIEGATSITCQNGTLSSVTNSSATLRAVDLTASSAVVTASVTVAGSTFSGSCFISKVQDGAPGAAAFVVVSTPAQAFTRATSAASFAPASITLTANPYGGSATYQWQYWSGSAWTSITGATAATYTAASGDFTDARTYRVQATIGGTVYSDQVTLVQLTGGSNGANGANAISGYLTNEATTLAADSTGAVASFASAGGTFKVFDGITDKTGTAGPVTYSVPSQTGCTVAITSAGVYSVSAMSADSATATLQAVYGGVTLQKVISLAKSKAGAAGASVTGPRGAGHFYATGSAWSDTTADAACPGGKIVSDVVTISNGTTYALEKKWDGSAWNPTGVVIDGSLLVTNSVKAASVDTKGLVVRDNSGNAIVGIGVPLAAGYEAPDTKNSDIVVGGRNLAVDSKFARGLRPYSSGSAILSKSISGAVGAKELFFDSNGGNAYIEAGGPGIPVVAGKTYMLTFGYKTQTSGTITGTSSGWYPDGGAPFVTMPLPVLVTGGAEVRSELQWTCPAGVTQILPRFGMVCTGYSWMSVEYFKVEEGNKATGWSPAPEDNAVDIADKLSTTSASSLAATVTLATGGSILSGTTTNGTFQNPSGFYGVQGGVTKFSVPISGDPTFAGQLTAAYGTFGAVSIAAGGSFSSGQTAYNTGTGWWWGYSGSTPVMSIGVAGGQALTWDGTNLLYSGGIANQMSVSVTKSIPSSRANSTTVVGLGSLSLVISGGQGPYTISYAITSSFTSPDSSDYSVYIDSGDGTTAVSFSGRVPSNTMIRWSVLATVTDSRGLIKTITTSCNTQFGTPV